MKTYGWFEYSDDYTLMRNVETGQSLRRKVGYFLSKENISLEYSDSEIKQPLKMVCKENVRKFGEKIIISPLLNLSYKDCFSTPPSYGLWRRIDDFITDALVCWPESIFEDQDGSDPLLTVTGCWFQGRWNADKKRTFLGRKSITLKNINAHPVVQPWVIPLDTQAPLQWSFVDHENPVTECVLAFQVDKEFNIPYIPRDVFLEEFQDKVPYLIRSDKKAVIFPARLEPASHRGEYPEVFLWYTYMDEEIFFTFRSCYSYKLEMSTCKNYGFRNLPPNPNFYASSVMGMIGDKSYSGPYGHSYLSYPVWLKMRHTLMDAWPQWEQNGKRRLIQIDPAIKLPENYGRRGYVGDFGPDMTHGYCAGMVNSWTNVKF